MSNKQPTWCKWYRATWLISRTRRSIDSAAARGLYLDCIFYNYFDGAIPAAVRNDLIRLIGCSPEEFDQAWPQIAHKFDAIPDRPGWLTMAKVDEVLAEVGYVTLARSPRPVSSAPKVDGKTMTAR